MIAISYLISVDWCPRSVDSVQMSVLEFTMPIMMTQGSDGRLISVRHVVTPGGLRKLVTS
jgi:hypothetical protein